MAEHYYSASPTSEHREFKFEEEIIGYHLSFVGDSGVFSKEKVDLGTRLLISALNFSGDEKILDMGCGYGPIGIVSALMVPNGHVVMVDINSRAVELSRRNLSLNKVDNAEVRNGDSFNVIYETDFDAILSNPPIRAGKQVIYSMVDESINHLCVGGRLIMVAKTNQGVKSLEKKMQEVYGNVRELEKGSGFRVVESTKQ